MIAIGILHHLDDLEANSLFKLAYEAMPPQGRIVTLDGCFTAGQGFWSRFFVSRDRGKNVRAPEAYLDLAKQVFADCHGSLATHKELRIPYTLWIMECKKTIKRKETDYG